MRYSIGVVAVTLLVFLLVLPVSAQDATPTTTADANVAIADLNDMIDPLYKEQLIVEADGWKDLVQQTAMTVSAKKIEVRAAKDNVQPLREELFALKETLAQRVQRLEAVLAALAVHDAEAVQPYQTYISTVTGVDIDATDVGGMAYAMRNWVTSQTGGVKWAKGIASFIATLLVFLVMSRIAAALVRRTLTTVREDLPDILLQFFVKTTRKIIVVFGIIVALSMIGVNMGPFLAAMGVAGFVIGFALQQSLNNFAAGLMILFHRPYDIGDYVHAGGVSGTVHSMSLVSTVLRTGDNQNIVVPNGAIWGSVITNVNANETRRLDLTFGIGYGDDIGKAIDVLREVLEANLLVLEEPESRIEMHELADSSVNIICRPWVKTGDYWQLYWELHRAVKMRFDAEGISIPYPQRDVHVHEVATT